MLLRAPQRQGEQAHAHVPAPHAGAAPASPAGVSKYNSSRRAHKRGVPLRLQQRGVRRRRRGRGRFNSGSGQVRPGRGGGRVGSRVDVRKLAAVRHGPGIYVQA